MVLFELNLVFYLSLLSLSLGFLKIWTSSSILGFIYLFIYFFHLVYMDYLIFPDYWRKTIHPLFFFFNVLILILMFSFEFKTHCYFLLFLFWIFWCSILMCLWWVGERLVVVMVRGGRLVWGRAKEGGGEWWW